MNINIHEYLFLFVKFLNHIFDKMNFRMTRLVSMFPFPIKIITSSRKPIIPIDYSIRIYHGHDFEQKLIPQVDGHLIVGEQLFYETFNDK